MTRLPWVALVATVALVASGSAPARQPASSAYYASVIELLFSSQFGKEWQTLHPAQQRYVSRARFVDCANQVPLEQLERVDILSNRPSPRGRIPGTSVSATGRSITYAVTLDDATTLTYTSQAYKVAGRWRWTMDAAEIGAFKAGRCPDS